MMVMVMVMIVLSGGGGGGGVDWDGFSIVLSGNVFLG